MGLLDGWNSQGEPENSCKINLPGPRSLTSAATQKWLLSQEAKPTPAQQFITHQRLDQIIAFERQLTGTERLVNTVVDATGSVHVVNSRISFLSNAVVAGSYVSDPSTNTFVGDLTVTQSGTLSGGAGDLFDFKKSFLIHATNQIGFNLAASAVKFSSGGMHTNAITGMDLGSNAVAYAAAYVLQTNFAYGELHLESAADQICFTCGNIPTVASNGLYIGWLDLLGNANLVTNLHADSSINLYYNQNDSRNSYLAAASYQLTDCNFAPGGGWLYAIIPEPSTVLLLGLSGLVVLLRRRR